MQKAPEPLPVVGGAGALVQVKAEAITAGHAATTVAPADVVLVGGGLLAVMEVANIAPPKAQEIKVAPTGPAPRIHEAPTRHAARAAGAIAKADGGGVAVGPGPGPGPGDVAPPAEPIKGITGGRA